MSKLNEVVPAIRMWSQFEEERQIDFNGHYVCHEGESVLIDPVALDDAELAELKSLIAENSKAPLKAILLTNLHHERDSARLKKLFSVPVWVHEKDAAGLEEPADKTYGDGDPLPCGLRVVHLINQKTAGESAFYLAARKILIVGDSLIGRVAGKVNLLPPEKYADINKAKAGLAVLKTLDFDTLLVGDGHSILQGAKEEVNRFLEDPGV
jgi:glyoxylase-like metal-dependent hydrolase (beta-lactamase superfamily II)